MQTILHGVPQKIVALGIQCREEQRGALEIVDGIGVFDSFRERRSRSAGFERHFGSDGDHADFFWPVLADRHDIVIGADKRHDQTSEQRCADIVGVFFKIGSEAQRGLLRQFFLPDRESQRDAGDNGCGAASQAAGDRNFVLNVEMDGRAAEDFRVRRRVAWRAGSDFLRRAGEIRAAGYSAAAGDGAGACAGLHGGAHRQIQLQSQSEAIEARAEIGGGGWDANFECLALAWNFVIGTTRAI